MNGKKKFHHTLQSVHPLGLCYHQLWIVTLSLIVLRMLDFDCILVQLGMLVLAAAAVVLVGVSKLVSNCQFN